MSSADFSRSFTFLPRLGWNACTFLYAWLSFGGICNAPGARRGVQAKPARIGYHTGDPRKRMWGAPAYIDLLMCVCTFLRFAIQLCRGKQANGV